MTKRYSKVSNEQRHLLVKLIYEDGWSIRQAAIASQIYYPTAKAINKIYIAEKRIFKKQYRFRKIAPSTLNRGKGAKAFSDEAGEVQQSRDVALSTMLKPIREELDFSEGLYDSLDEAMIDVTEERVEEARRQNLPFDHYRLIRLHELKTLAAKNATTEASELPMRAEADELKFPALQMQALSQNESPKTETDGYVGSLQPAVLRTKPEDGAQDQNGSTKEVTSAPHRSSLQLPEATQSSTILFSDYDMQSGPQILAKAPSELSRQAFLISSDTPTATKTAPGKNIVTPQSLPTLPPAANLVRGAKRQLEEAQESQDNQDDFDLLYSLEIDKFQFEPYLRGITSEVNTSTHHETHLSNTEASEDKPGAGEIITKIVSEFEAQNLPIIWVGSLK